MLNTPLLCLLCLLCLNLAGQGNSPYSEQGIGGISDPSFQTNWATSGLGTTLSSPYFINPENPASYSRINYTLAEAGLFYAYNQYADSSSSGADNSLNIGHFGFAFPILPKLGVALGVMPFTKMDYDYNSNDLNQDGSQIERRFRGKGNLSQVFLGTGMSVGRFSIGVNGKFIFGEQTRTEQLEFLTAGFTNIRSQEISLVRGFTGQVGAIYEIPLSEEHQLKIGGTFDLGNNISANKYQVINNYSSSKTLIDGETVSVENHDDGTILVDTEDNPEKQKISLPTSYQAGISFSKNRQYFLALNYEYSAWDDLKVGGISQGMGRAQSIILGGEYVPNIDAKGIENYFKSVIYRAGINYGNSATIVKREQLTTYGINFGIGLPLKKYKYESEKFGSYLFTSFGYDRVRAHR